jgi:hypothetical protein
MYLHTLPLVATLAIVATAAAADGTAPAAAAPTPGISDALRSGKLSLAARYRYEQVNQRGFADEAHASTVRLALGYETGAWNGLTAFAQYEGIYRIGQKLFNDMPPGVAAGDYGRYPRVLDADGSDLNQAWVRWTGAVSGIKATAKLGRQEIILLNGRLVGNVAWRQNNQTFDGLTGSVSPLAGLDLPAVAKELTITGAYWNKVNRITGTDAKGTGVGGVTGANDGVLAGDSGLVSVGTKVPDTLTATAYGVWLQYRDVPAQSSQTIGLRIEGPTKLDATWSLPWTVEYAKQKDLGNNPNSYSANFYNAEIGVTWKGIGPRIAYSRLDGGSGSDAFQTPLATGHAFNGWAEMFLATPARGLESWSLSWGGPLPMVAEGLRVQVVGYRFYAQSGHAHYGDELDLNVEYLAKVIDPKLLLGVKIGGFRDDEAEQAGAGVSFKDTVKTSLYAVWTY